MIPITELAHLQIQFKKFLEVFVTGQISCTLDTPIVALNMGPTLNPEEIKEGDGVYFECKIKSNPKQYKTAWFHDVSLFFEKMLLFFASLKYLFKTND